MTTRFRSDIEGLRALAVVPVVVFHAFPSVVPGGYVGVDIFFVISGFLITSLLMRHLEEGRYSAASFYAARIRRIVPALFFMLACCLPAAWWWLAPKDLHDFARTLAATALFVSNFEFYRTTGYFDGAAELKPLLHTWSLAVEEQYYILFPLLLAWMHRRARHLITAMLVLVGVASLGLSVYLVRTNPSLAFYFAGSRAFELMIGSWLAVVGSRLGAPRWLRESLAAVGVVALLAAFVLFNEQTPFPGLAALLPCVGTALIIWSGSHGPTQVGSALSTRPLRWFGAQSYSLYLWHWPVLVFMRHALFDDLTAMQMLAAIGVAVAMAAFSLRYIETPVRRSTLSDRQLLWFGAGTILVALLAAWGLARHADSELRRGDAAAAYFQGAQDVSPERARCHATEAHPISYAQRCVFGLATARPQMAIWGDSHGAELAPALGEIAAREGWAVAQITASSCPPAIGFDRPDRPGCREHNQAVADALAADPHVETVIMIARHGPNLRIDAVGFEAGMLRSVRTLQNAGKAVVLVAPIPGYRYSVPAALGRNVLRGEDPPDYDQSFEDYTQRNQAVLTMLQRLAAVGVTVVQPSDVLCLEGRCRTAIDGRSLYFDHNHLSMTGARLVAQQVRQSVLLAR